MQFNRRNINKRLRNGDIISSSLYSSNSSGGGSSSGGILSGNYLPATQNADGTYPTYEEVKAVYDKYYANEKYVRVLDKDVCPETKWVEGSNYVDVNFKIDPRTKRIIMMGAMDNLVKGAAGQAVQNMNLLFGLPENEGLNLVPMFP